MHRKLNFVWQIDQTRLDSFGTPTPGEDDHDDDEEEEDIDEPLHRSELYGCPRLLLIVDWRSTSTIRSIRRTS